MASLDGRPLCAWRTGTLTHRISTIQLPFPGFDELRADARTEGYRFIDRLADDWESGANRFDAPGETLCGCAENGLLVAVGGLNRDPFADGADTGRIRRVYVRPNFRRQGIGRALVAALIDQGRGRFQILRLRTDNAGAARLYEQLGFEPVEEERVTHILRFHAAADRMRGPKPPHRIVQRAKTYSP